MGRAGNKTWRLKRTLSRPVEFQPLRSDDLRHIYAGYKKGSLRAMGASFADGELEPKEFRSLFEGALLKEYDQAWTIFANTRLGFIPIGIVLGGWAPSKAYIVIGGVVWMPWASRRNIIEGMVNFMRGVASECPVMGYAVGHHKRLYEVCCMHGVMRRVGTSQIAIRGEPAALYETRMPAYGCR